MRSCGDHGTGTIVYGLCFLKCKQFYLFCSLLDDNFSLALHTLTIGTYLSYKWFFSGKMYKINYSFHTFGFFWHCKQSNGIKGLHHYEWCLVYLEQGFISMLTCSSHSLHLWIQCGQYLSLFYGWINVRQYSPGTDCYCDWARGDGGSV